MQNPYHEKRCKCMSQPFTSMQHPQVASPHSRNVQSDITMMCDYFALIFRQNLCVLMKDGFDEMVAKPWLHYAPLFYMQCEQVCGKYCWRNKTRCSLLKHALLHNGGHQQPSINQESGYTMQLTSMGHTNTE